MKTGKMRKVIRAVPFSVTLAAGFIIIAGLLAQPLMAQPWGQYGPQRSPEEVVQILTERLDLTPEQVEAITPVITEKHRKMNEIRDKNGTNRRAGRTEMQKLRWDTERKLSDILTDEQVDRYLELRQEQREQRGRGKFGDWKAGRKFNKTPEQVMERLSARLQLTDEQAAEIAPIIQESFERRREVFERYRGTDFTTRESMRAEMRGIGDDTHAQISTLLNDSQVEEFNALREERCMSRPGPMGF